MNPNQNLPGFQPWQQPQGQQPPQGHQPPQAPPTQGGWQPAPQAPQQPAPAPALQALPPTQGGWQPAPQAPQQQWQPAPAPAPQALPPTQGGWQPAPQAPQQQQWQPAPAPAQGRWQQGQGQSWQPQSTRGGRPPQREVDPAAFLAGTSTAPPRQPRNPDLLPGDSVLALVAHQWHDNQGVALRLEWKVIQSSIHQPGLHVNTWISYRYHDAGQREMAALLRALAPNERSGVPFEQIAQAFSARGVPVHVLQAWASGAVWSDPAAADGIANVMFGAGAPVCPGLRVLARVQQKTGSYRRDGTSVSSVSYMLVPEGFGS